MGVFARLLGRSSDKSPGAAEAAVPDATAGTGGTGGTGGEEAQEAAADTSAMPDSTATPDSDSTSAAGGETTADADRAGGHGDGGHGDGGDQDSAGQDSAGAATSGTDCDTSARVAPQRSGTESDAVPTAAGDSGEDGADSTDSVGIPKQQSADEAADSETGDGSRR